MEEKYSNLAAISERLKLIRAQMIEGYNIEDKDERLKKMRPLFDEEIVLFKKKQTIEQELYLSMPPVKFNNLIDLRPKSIDYPYNYLIYLHDTKTVVGDISFRGYHTSPYIGDIGYSVIPEFRGNNYAYEALVLLSEKLFEDGIPDFWVGVESKNVPSIKTIERYGGKIIENNGSALLFQCETKQRIDFEKTITSER